MFGLYIIWYAVPAGHDVNTPSGVAATGDGRVTSVWVSEYACGHPYREHAASTSPPRCGHGGCRVTGVVAKRQKITCRACRRILYFSPVASGTLSCNEGRHRPRPDAQEPMPGGGG